MGPYGRISHFVSFLKCSLIPTPGYLLARTAYDCMDSGGQERGNPLSHTDRSETCSLCRSRARSVAPAAPRLPGQEVAVAETQLRPHPSCRCCCHHGGISRRSLFHPIAFTRFLLLPDTSQETSPRSCALPEPICTRGPWRGRGAAKCTKLKYYYKVHSQTERSLLVKITTFVFLWIY